MSTDGQTSHPRSVEDLIYSNVEPLDVQRHAKLGMMRDDTPYGFAAKQHYVPLQVGEFGRAAIDYPIIFAGEERVPMAMLGITAGQNLFIDAAGGFRAGA